ncbi:aryl-alcohol-oxidase from pleurotus Eryingii [Pholiota conissans]|uniref:pyranose dehydrogenase (acceptor) n=1 Tax=Pholiota conissans TaxID=109636 RepID=A0A9P5Z9A7_9AGAR|nr:aryl-alcohol-oxidase from pleurotus Eryingii [Pholiota conissans]
MRHCSMIGLCYKFNKARSGGFPSPQQFAMWSSKLLSFVLTSLLASPALAATITQSTQLTTQTFDYIIVGAGTGGLVVANRLSEDPRVSVLVIEAGVSDDSILGFEAPFLGPTMTPNTIYDWNYTVTPQPGMGGRVFTYPRGRILGGSSTTNFMFHQYGSSEDWNRYAAFTGDLGWAWSNMRQYVQKHETFVPPPGPDSLNKYLPSNHGFHGTTFLSVLSENQTDIDSRVLATLDALHDEFPFNRDMGGGDHSLLGVGYAVTSGANGVRSSSSTSYLAQANGRPNLTVLINSVVTKLIQTPSTKGLKAFRKVQVASSPGTAPSPGGNPVISVTARKEVILSAGFIGTTQILQLSGIGDSNDLSALGIPTIINNPSVGRNLSDHTQLANVFSVRGTESYDSILRNETAIGAEVQEYLTNKTGLLAGAISNNLGFLRLPRNASIFDTVQDPTPGPNSPHWEIIIGNVYFNPDFPTPPSGSYLSIVTSLISPTSRKSSQSRFYEAYSHSTLIKHILIIRTGGTVKLASNNPFDKPLIDPQFLMTDFDIFTMREAVKAVLRFFGYAAWSDYIIGPFGDLFAAAKDDASIDAYVRGVCTSILHGVGTASMAPVNAKFGVVDPNLKVKGVDGLRVVDASVLPLVPSAHTQGPVYLVAERASDLIKSGH